MKLIYFLLYNSHFKGFYIPYKFSLKVVQGRSTNHKGSLQFSYPLLLRVCHGIRAAEEIFILFASLEIFSSWNDPWVILSCKLVKLHLCFLVQKHFGSRKGMMQKPSVLRWQTDYGHWRLLLHQSCTSPYVHSPVLLSMSQLAVIDRAKV